MRSAIERLGPRQAVLAREGRMEACDAGRDCDEGDAGQCRVRVPVLEQPVEGYRDEDKDGRLDEVGEDAQPDESLRAQRTCSPNQPPAPANAPAVDSRQQMSKARSARRRTRHYHGGDDRTQRGQIVQAERPRRSDVLAKDPTVIADHALVSRADCADHGLRERLGRRPSACWYCAGRSSCWPIGFRGCTVATTDRTGISACARTPPPTFGGSATTTSPGRPPA